MLEIMDETVRERPLYLDVPWQDFALRSDLQPAFTQNDGMIRCIDERTPGGIHVAGSGILLKNEAVAIQLFRQSGIRGITRHAQCGAEAIWAQQNSLTKAAAEEVLSERAQRVAKVLAVPYEFIGEKTMQKFGPMHQHQTATIYYDATGKFNPATIPDLPLGFVVSRGIYEAETYPLSEVRLAQAIMFGAHGLGEQWFRKNNKKITIVSISTKNLPDQKMNQELQTVLPKLSDLVILTGFDAGRWLSSN